MSWYNFLTKLHATSNDHCKDWSNQVSSFILFCQSNSLLFILITFPGCWIV